MMVSAWVGAWNGAQLAVAQPLLGVLVALVDIRRPKFHRTARNLNRNKANGKAQSDRSESTNERRAALQRTNKQPAADSDLIIGQRNASGSGWADCIVAHNIA